MSKRSRRRQKHLAPARNADTTSDALLWGNNLWSTPSVTGIDINQATALNASAVMACVTMLAEDVAKLPWTVMRHSGAMGRTEAKDHWLYEKLMEPNDWQNGFEFKEQLQVGLILRGNAYAVKIRDGRGRIIKFVPVNPDWVALWEAPDGNLYYRVTPSGLHMMAELRDQPFLIPFAGMLHIRGFSVNGLLGASRIMLAREAIALGLAQEQQAARWMGQAAKPSGMFTTDQKLADTTATRLKDQLKGAFTGLANSGKIILGEQGLKFEKFGMTSGDLEFIASRKFQIEEIARIFRIPMHMLAALERSTNNNIAQQAQEYINFTLTGYTDRWRAKFSSDFGLWRDDLSIEFDYRELTTADMTTRVNNWRTMIMSMMAKPDEARLDLGLVPEGGDAAKLHYPQNMDTQGSQSTGSGEGGRPKADEPTPARIAARSQPMALPKPARRVAPADYDMVAAAALAKQIRDTACWRSL
ncbi:phage portal protein [Bradyrhizobium sp. HKCCYLRH3099]|uniref:phage portal protein n=1 Tax=unclassified Bradyrhizobium TaxID=2631580 RepID=UPI003EBF82CF